MHFDFQSDGVACRIKGKNLFNFNVAVGSGKNELLLFFGIDQIQFAGCGFKSRVRGNIGAGFGECHGKRVGHAVLYIDQFNKFLCFGFNRIFTASEQSFYLWPEVVGALIAILIIIFELQGFEGAATGREHSRIMRGFHKDVTRWCFRLCRFLRRGGFFQHSFFSLGGCRC
jgi:hypothetical protein